MTALLANATELGIAQLYYPGNGIEMFGNPLLTDPLNIRVPDIAVRVVPGERSSASNLPPSLTVDLPPTLLHPRGPNPTMHPILTQPRRSGDTCPMPMLATMPRRQ